MFIMQGRIETQQHLLFTCSLSKQIWQKMLSWLLITRSSIGWNEELKLVTCHATSKYTMAGVYIIAAAAAVYHIWQERNHRIFQYKERTTAMISRLIIQDIHHRASMIPRPTGYMHSLDFYL